MNEIIKYYSEKIAEEKGSYNPFIYEIRINREQNDSLFSSILYHEYTHYIQNFTTISGFTYFYNTLKVMLASFSHAGVHQKKNVLPLKTCSSMKVHLGSQNPGNLLKCGREGTNYSKSDFPFTTTQRTNYDLYQKQILNPFTKKQDVISFISMNGFDIPLDEWVIKENMANTVTFIRKNQKDSLTQYEKTDYLSNQYKEYTIITDFIDIFLPTKNILKLTYQICEIALNMFPFSDTIFKCLDIIKNNNNTYLNLAEDDIIRDIKQKINFSQNFNHQLNNLKCLANKQITTLQNLSYNNEFLYMASKFYSVIIQGLNYRYSNNSFYQIFNDTYISSLVPLIACPPIYVKGKQKPLMIGRPIDSIGYISSAYIMQFQFWFGNYSNKCPFYNMCTHKKNKYCIICCFRNIYKKEFNNCYLSNSLLINGIKKETVKQAGWLKRKY